MIFCVHFCFQVRRIMTATGSHLFALLACPPYAMNRPVEGGYFKASSRASQTGEVCKRDLFVTSLRPEVEVGVLVMQLDQSES